MDWLGEFFAAIPDVVAALWQFGDAWFGLAVSAGSLGLVVFFLVVAGVMRSRLGWISALSGGMAAFIAAFWVFGVLPSAWIYFVDGQAELLSDTVIPSQITLAGTTVAADFYEVVRDLVVVGVATVGIVAFGVLAAALQKRLGAGSRDLVSEG